MTISNYEPDISINNMFDSGKYVSALISQFNKNTMHIKISRQEAISKYPALSAHEAMVEALKVEYVAKKYCFI